MDRKSESQIAHSKCELYSSTPCLIRLKHDLMSICRDPPPGIFVTPDEESISLVHALIIGTSGTPYEGGFFYFILRFPHEYPIVPPTVQFMTTGGSKVRFNPNLYKCGKVCLSILGTWTGPCWSPAQTLASLLISIQSLLCDKPYHNEPGYESLEMFPGDANRYNDIIQHETLRVAVIGMLDNDFGLVIPQSLREIIEKSFLQFYDFYKTLAENKIKLTGTIMQDPFGESRGCFTYSNLLRRLKSIYKRLEASDEQRK